MAAQKYEYREAYKRNLPHLQPEGAPIFVTFRLVGSLPKHVVEDMIEEKRKLSARLAQLSAVMRQDAQLELHRRNFVRLERCLDRCSFGPDWLKEKCVAELVSAARHKLDGREIRLDAFCVMSNHVHSLFVPMVNEGKPVPLSKIMQSIKGASSY